MNFRRRISLGFLSKHFCFPNLFVFKTFFFNGFTKRTTFFYESFFVQLFFQNCFYILFQIFFFQNYFLYIFYNLKPLFLKTILKDFLIFQNTFLSKLFDRNFFYNTFNIFVILIFYQCFFPKGFFSMLFFKTLTQSIVIWIQMLLLHFVYSIHRRSIVPRTHRQSIPKIHLYIFPLLCSQNVSMTPFLRTEPLSYHTFEDMILFRSGNLYLLCSPGNLQYQKIIYFLIFSSKKVEIDNEKYKSLIISRFNNNYKKHDDFDLF